jgi:hypothetical protein
MKRILLIFSLVFFYSCETPVQEKNTFKVQSDSLIIKWKMDSSGCNGFRNSERMDSIFKKYNLALKSIDSIKIILGNPNDEWDSDSLCSLEYYFGSICIDDTIRPKSDKCWINIEITKTRKISNSYFAVCE